MLHVTTQNVSTFPRYFMLTTSMFDYLTASISAAGKYVSGVFSLFTALSLLISHWLISALTVVNNLLTSNHSLYTDGDCTHFIVLAHGKACVCLMRACHSNVLALALPDENLLIIQLQNLMYGTCLFLYWDAHYSMTVKLVELFFLIVVNWFWSESQYSVCVHNFLYNWAYGGKINLNDYVVTQ